MRVALIVWLAITCLTTQSTCAQTAVPADTADAPSQKTQGENADDRRSQNASDKPIEELPIKYIGNCQSLKFHRPSCPFGKAMYGGKAVFFHFRKNAIDSGYQPCRYCLPPIWKSVQAKVLKSDPAENQPDSREIQRSPFEK